jgi:large subunit ribosomal protein L15
MSLQAHSLTPASGSHKRSKRVGRGNGSQKGTTAGRGTKGQKARSGGRGGNARRSFRQSLLKVPKLRGFTSFKTKPQTVTLAMIERVFAAGTTVSPETLKRQSLIRDVDAGVKIVSSGKLTKSLKFEGCLASKATILQVETAGGTIQF